ncbi:MULTISPECIES: HNH endonuclease [Pseudonocardia]|nr:MULTISPECIES: HNH endonuclease signature motif containing protein [Pseudonocardia]
MTTVIDAPAAPDPPAGPVRPAVSDPPAAADLLAVPDLSAVPDLYAVRARFEQLAAVVDEVSPSPVLVDRMIALVAVRNSVEAALVATELAFARRRAADSAAVIDPERLERSIGAEIGLANRASPTVGRNRMRTARDLHDGLGHVRGLFAAGELDGYRVSIVVGATAHLDAGERAEVDRRLAGHDIARLGPARLRSLVAALAAEVAPEKFRQRCLAARTGRRVTLRQAPDGMVDLRAHLPVEQGVACYAALRRAFDAVQVDPEPLTRSRGQVMADTFVERVTGRVTAEHVDVQVQVVVPLEALLDEGSPLPAEVPGFGPIPVGFLARARGRRLLRRLLTVRGTVIGGDSRARCFPAGLADLIRARDRHRCTAPYCDAPARHIDHVVRAADGGPTGFDNGRAVCELHNQLREQPGWWVEPTAEGTCTTTPTGHSYLHRTEPLHSSGHSRRDHPDTRPAQPGEPGRPSRGDEQ